MPVLETRRPRPGLAGSALTTGRTMRSEPLDRTPGMSSHTSLAARGARSSKSGRNPRGPPVGAGAQDGSWGAGDSSSAPQDAGPQPARNHPLSICKWSGRTPTQKPRGRPGGQALQALHRMERSILITEGFTGRQTEHRLRTVVGAKMGPRPVCGPLRPLCARPSPPGPPRVALTTRPGLSPRTCLRPFPALHTLVVQEGGRRRHRPTPIPTGVSELAL